MITFGGKEIHFGENFAKTFANHVEAPAWVMLKSDGLSKQEVIEKLTKIVVETVEHLPLTALDVVSSIFNA